MSWFHSLQATSHALQPMQTLVSVKKPFACAVIYIPIRLGTTFVRPRSFA